MPSIFNAAIGEIEAETTTKEGVTPSHDGRPNDPNIQVSISLRSLRRPGWGKDIRVRDMRY